MRFKKKIHCFSLPGVWVLFGIAFFVFFTSFTFAQDNRQLTVDKAAGSDKRIALVIGNGAYTKAKTLPNPANDATDMAAALKSLGFEVLSGTDQNKRQMETLIREFGTKLANGGVGLFYYAGHGIQVNGYNYLVPIDADIPEENEVKYAAVPMNFVLDKMVTANNSLNIVILDACRNNPFARSWRNYRDISDSDGLARVTPPRGTLVIYATQPGNVASDGTGRNGLFTASLLTQIKKPNLELDPLIKALTRDVAQASGNKQYPWREGTFTGDFYFSVSAVSQSIPTPTPLQTAIPKPTPLPTPTPVTASQGFDAEGTYWQEVSNRNTQSGYELYLAEYPKGKYAAEANTRIAGFKQAEAQRLKDIERSKWRDAQNLNTAESYNSYLTSYPNGEFVADARSGIKALESKSEQAKWLDAQNLNTKESYNSYLAAFPNGKFVSDARSGINVIDAREDQAKWDEVQILNRKSAFQSYLSAYPNGKYSATARQKIKDFDDADAIRLREQEKATERAKWHDAERLKTIAGYDGYLAAYPNGDYASLARLRLDGLGKKVLPVSTTNTNSSNTAMSAGAVRKNSIGMELVYIPAGEFMMGPENPSYGEEPVRKVTISNGFWMGKFEVTQGQWQAVMGKNPSYFKDCGTTCPVENVKWKDVQGFITRLNAKNDGFQYSLPSEAEWEYAARAGTTGDRYGLIDDIAWYANNSGRTYLDAESIRNNDLGNYLKRLTENGGRTHPVGKKTPNNFGLYDMLGNVKEWCQDIRSRDYSGLSTDGSANVNLRIPAGHEKVRVVRGGSYNWGADYSSSANRDGQWDYESYDSIGFRVVARLK